MFARSIIRRVSPFTVFMIRSKNHPALKACPTVQKRGKLLGKMYRNMSAEERTVIMEAARKTPGFPHIRGRNPVRPPRLPNAYNRWVARYIKENKVTLSKAAKAFKLLQKKKAAALKAKKFTKVTGSTKKAVKKDDKKGAKTGGKKGGTKGGKKGGKK
jgi:hypothetical protein